MVSSCEEQFAERGVIVRPTIMQDPILGEITHDDDGYTARVMHDGRTVTVCLMVDKDEDPTPWIVCAGKVVSRIAEHAVAAREIAVIELVNLANEWRDDVETPLFTPETLRNTFHLNGMLVYHDGSTEFFFDDGDVFAGHAVVVDLNRDGTYDNARIEG